MLFFDLFLIEYVHCQQVEERHLLGAINKTALKNSTYQWYHNNYENYKVDTLTLRPIHNLKGKYLFKLFMATWCSDSKSFVPKFLKIFDFLGIPNNRLEIIAVNKDKSYPQKLLSQYGVVYLPTLIIVKRNKEVNRIEEFSVASIEKDMVQILTSEKYTPFHQRKWFNN